MHRIFRVKAYEKEHGPHFNTDIYRAAAYGAYAGDVAYGRSGYGCGCNNYWG